MPPRGAAPGDIAEGQRRAERAARARVYAARRTGDRVARAVEARDPVGDEGADTLEGGDGDDQLIVLRAGGAIYDGGAGNDLLTMISAAPGAAAILGGSGADTLDAGLGGTLGPAIVGGIETLLLSENELGASMIQIGGFAAFGASGTARRCSASAA
ncbi:hypothetical protein J4558_13085 [Leptolyngbya sp. 15MV]|nr:hypothetical protein J4558_13085 [Leptolyngbya sp. 15MV]